MSPYPIWAFGLSARTQGRPAPAIADSPRTARGCRSPESRLRRAQGHYLMALRSGDAVDSVTTGDFTEAEDPFALFDAWFEEASASEINDPEAMTLATVDEAGLPGRADAPVQGRRCARGRLLQQRRERQGSRTRRPPQGGGAVPLEVAATAGAVPRARSTPLGRGRGRRLFRLAPAPEPDRRLGEPAVAPARIARGAGGGGRGAMRGGSATATFRGPPIGAAGGSRRCRSSSGATARSGCTTASCSAAPTSTRRGSGRRLYP